MTPFTGGLAAGLYLAGSRYCRVPTGAEVASVCRLVCCCLIADANVVFRQFHCTMSGTSAILPADYLRYFARRCAYMLIKRWRYQRLPTVTFDSVLNLSSKWNSHV